MLAFSVGFVVCWILVLGFAGWLGLLVVVYCLRAWACMRLFVYLVWLWSYADLQ